MSNQDQQTPAADPNPGFDSRPPLFQDRAFVGMTATQFLGAFNDNLFKQALLLLFVAVPVVGGTRDMQWLGMLVFSVPFIFFSGYAGYLSDRHSKRTVIFFSKVAEIAIMTLGALLFVFYALNSLSPWLVVVMSIVLFCMGSQSAFFGPGKYGILPELFRERDLPQANGIILMTTFIAIIFGSALAGLFFPDYTKLTESRIVSRLELSDEQQAEAAEVLESRAQKLRVVKEREKAERKAMPDDRQKIVADSNSKLANLLTGGQRFSFNWLWLLGLFCIAVAIIGTRTSLWIRQVPRSAPNLEFQVSGLWISRETRKMLWTDRPLLEALVASSVFWLVAAMVQMAVIALGKLQMGMNEIWTSVLTAAVSVGIAVGSIIAGTASKNRFNTKIMKTGLWGLVVFLFLMAPQGFGERPHLLGYWGSFVALIILGTFTGMFAVPLQVFLQSRPPADEKGRMIAAQNLCNWIGITLSAGLYFASGKIIDAFDWPRSYNFAITAVLLLFVAVLYRPTETPLSQTESQHVGSHSAE